MVTGGTSKNIETRMAIGRMEDSWQRVVPRPGPAGPCGLSQASMGDTRRDEGAVVRVLQIDVPRRVAPIVYKNPAVRVFGGSPSRSQLPG